VRLYPQSNFMIESWRGPATTNQSLLWNVTFRIISRSKDFRSFLSDESKGPDAPFVRDLTQSRVFARTRRHASARVSSIQIEGREPAIERRGNHGGQSGMDYALRVL